MISLNTVTVAKNHVIVDFGDDIPGDKQGVVLLQMEKSLRAMGLKVEVFKKTMQDDSKLRRNMTKEQRDNL